MEEEEWRPVIGYEELYAVSSNGRIKNRRGMILKGLPDTKNYLRVCLYKKIDGKLMHEWLFIHRLVAIAFIDNPDSKPEIDHIDGDIHNNGISNLRWATHKENIHNENTFPKVLAHIKRINDDPTIHAKSVTTQSTPEARSKASKLKNAVKKRVRCKETGEEFDSMHEAARVKGITYKAILHSCQRMTQDDKQVKTINNKTIYHFEYIIGD